MRKEITIRLSHQTEFKRKILFWAEQFTSFLYLDSSNYYNAYKGNQKNFLYHSFESIIAVDSIFKLPISDNGNFENLKHFITGANDWIFGHLNYDLKNEIEQLQSDNKDFIEFPAMHFFVPRYIFIIHQNELKILYREDYSSEVEVKKIIDDIEKTKVSLQSKINKIDVQPRVTKTEYVSTVNHILDHIHYGDIYEMNYCNEYFAEQTKVDPINLFINLQDVSPTPFSGYYKFNDKYLISASPERFMKKTGNKIISQPIKGTTKRGENREEDKAISELLKKNPKEKAENTMIVDLVRNDLSKNAARGTVQVEEFCGVYPFSHVHQMISTISAELREDVHPVDVIRDAFPMGSMTGAPKIRAMKLIERYEKSRRGLYSGSIGYFTPDHDFDFNVVIRSILYNKTNKYLSYMVGSAITAGSIPENEYHECIVKAQAMKDSLSSFL